MTPSQGLAPPPVSRQPPPSLFSPFQHQREALSHSWPQALGSILGSETQVTEVFTVSRRECVSAQV